MSTLSSYSSSERPDLESVPSFFNLGTTSLTETHLGLNVSCTSFSTSDFLLFKELNKDIPTCSSNKNPLISCCCKILQTSCSRSTDCLVKTEPSFLKVSRTLLFNLTSWMQYVSMS